jgi:hypothetical protein
MQAISIVIRNEKLSNKKEQYSKNIDCGFTGRFAKRFSGERPFPCAFEFRFCCFVCGGCLNGEA